MDRQEVMSEVARQTGYPFNRVARFIVHVPGSYVVFTETDKAFTANDDPDNHEMRGTTLQARRDYETNGDVNTFRFLGVVMQSGTKKDWVTVDGVPAHKHSNTNPNDRCTNPKRR